MKAVPKCTAHMASRIVGLLMADVGIGGDLAQLLQPMPACAAPAERTSNREPEHKGKGRKLTLDIRRFIRDSAGQPVPEILTQIQEKWGVSLSKAAIYTEWRSSHLPLGHPTPTHPLVSR